MKIGILGGTFDPFHRGHLEPVLAARSLMEWDRVVYVPAFRQPFKPEQATASGYHRFTMTVLATESIATIMVSPQELERGQISYTVETLEWLRGRLGQDTLDWIIGDDNLAQLAEWKKIERIFELANFVVLSRLMRPDDVPPPYRGRLTRPGRREQQGSIVFAENTAVPVSSTEIRQRIRQGQPISDLVDPRVKHYIEHNGLYREAQ